MGGDHEQDRAVKRLEDRGVDAPYARPAPPCEGKPDQLAERVQATGDRQEALLDEAVEETFPGSDPISPKRII